MKLALSLLVALWPAAAQPRFVWRDTGNGRLQLSEDGKPVLVYNYGPQLKPGAPENRRRCCYIFPVYTPAGVSPLDDFPADHWHHRGLFWAWPIVETEGKTYDLWMQLTVQPHTIGTSTSGPNLDAQTDWEVTGKPIVHESLRLTAFPAQNSAREIEVALTWRADHAPVTLRGSAEAAKSYGGFSARFAPRESTVIRADGETLAKDEDRNPRRWAELEGAYNGRRAVVRITPDASDPGVPLQWCLRSYGFVGASFPGRTETVDGYTLEPGKPLTLRFRVRLADLP